VGSCNASDEDKDCGGVEEGFSGGNGGLRIFPEPPVAPEPSEGALYHPASWMDGKADLIGRLRDNLNRDGRRLAGVLTPVTRIGEPMWMKGNGLREAVSSGPAPSRSCTLAVLILSTRGRPSVSTRACRLRPDTFLAAS
jgi:hypothetical protein